MPLIQLTDIMAYIGVGLRPLQEGEAVLNAKHILLCGLNQNNKDVLAICLQSSKINAAPHKIKIQVDSCASQKIVANCSCKAGNGGKCKHIVAVLLYINRNELENLSSTDIEQAWGKNKGKELTAVEPLKKYCHVKGRKCNETLSDQEEKDIFKSLLLAVPSSEAGIHLSKERMGNVIFEHIETHDRFLEVALEHCLLKKFENFQLHCIPMGDQERQFYDCRVRINIDDAIKLAIKTCNQDSNLWLEERKLRITGSTCYSLYTYCFNSNPYWDKKIKRHLENKFKGNTYTEYGKIEERNAYGAFKILQKNVEKLGLIINPSFPWLGFSPDGVIVEDGSISEFLEIKCPIAGANKTVTHVLQELPYIYYSNGEPYLKKKHTYYGQVQLGMVILNLSVCKFLIYCSYDKTFVVIPIKRDPQFIEDLMKKLNFVYFMYYLPFLINSK